jgi:hypothetical protein
MNSGQLYVRFVSKITTSVMKYEPDSIYCLRKIKESRAWLGRPILAGAKILNFMTQIENRNRIPVSIFLSVANFSANFAAIHCQMPREDAVRSFRFRATQ